MDGYASEEDGGAAQGFAVDAGPDPAAYPLHFVALHGDEQHLSQLLAQGADANAPDAEGKSPLIYSVQGNARGCAAQLLAAGADASYPDATGLGPVHWAASLGLGKLVKLLLQYNALWDAPDGDGRTALHWASTAESTKGLQALCTCSVSALLHPSLNALPSLPPLLLPGPQFAPPRPLFSCVLLSFELAPQSYAACAYGNNSSTLQPR